jgi:hypothetical protein
MSRVFLMKWYHFSVEYFEDLRNINHCEFIVMKKDPTNGKYILQNQLRTWTEYKRERLARGSISQPDPPTIPMRRKWGGCPEGCAHDQHNHIPNPTLRKPPVRQNTADLFNDENEPISRTPPRIVSGSPLAIGRNDSEATARLSSVDQGTMLDQIEKRDMAEAKQESSDGLNGLRDSTNIPSAKVSFSQTRLQRPSLLSLGGRDGGGTKSGAGSTATSSDEEEEEVDPLTIAQKHVKVPWSKHGAGGVQPHSLARALKGEFSTSVEDGGPPGRVLADALGDQSEDEKTDAEMDEEKEREKTEMQKIVEEEKKERSVAESVF